MRHLSSHTCSLKIQNNDLSSDEGDFRSGSNTFEVKWEGCLTQRGYLSPQMRGLLNSNSHNFELIGVAFQLKDHLILSFN